MLSRSSVQRCPTFRTPSIRRSTRSTTRTAGHRTREATNPRWLQPTHHSARNLGIQQLRHIHSPVQHQAINHRRDQVQDILLWDRDTLLKNRDTLHKDRDIHLRIQDIHHHRIRAQDILLKRRDIQLKDQDIRQVLPILHRRTSQVQQVLLRTPNRDLDTLRSSSSSPPSIPTRVTLPRPTATVHIPQRARAATTSTRIYPALTPDPALAFRILRYPAEAGTKVDIPSALAAMVRLTQTMSSRTQVAKNS